MSMLWSTPKPLLYDERKIDGEKTIETESEKNKTHHTKSEQQHNNLHTPDRIHRSRCMGIEQSRAKQQQ